MSRILNLCIFVGLVAGASAYSAVRDGTATRPAGDATARATTSRTTTAQKTSTRATRNNTARAGTLRVDNNVVRTNVRARGDSSVSSRPMVQVGRAATAVAGTPSAGILETRTGAEYARCKSAYFQCMDQFCQLKNDDYRRCSCSSRIYDLMSVRQNIIDTNSKITEFTENLDAVGLTAAQATAMHTASDGENALTADTSASKALLNAIMNSIRGGDTTVSGKMSDLNSINLSFDTVNMFGLTDTAQVIASYNGTELYNSVYPSCRTAVAADCNDASLQRAVTAYLMAIEQDCNTVQTALENKQKDLRAAVRESSAMLDLARIENRNKHNSDDMATCIGNVESAVLSEQVCGANYHRCLDNGEFIDVTTGAPITGVVKFYELQNLLKFDNGKDSVNQKLAQIASNRTFVKNFESKTKKFAADALDKCTEIADAVWAEYLDKALLDIYYAQKAKVQTIKAGCIDLITNCYNDRETAITAAMAELIDGTSEVSLLPDKIVLTRQMCDNYIESCNNMFDNTNIIAEYVDAQVDTDTTAACRAVVQQCFDSFGGANYENFYYPSSGLFTSGMVDHLVASEFDNKISALDWFTLYEYDENGNRMDGYKSKCAQRVAEIPSCADKVELVFGGLDAIIADRGTDTYHQYTYDGISDPANLAYGYGWANLDDGDTTLWDDEEYKFKNRRLRPTGVATEVYNQIIDTLTTQCMNLQGRFIEAQFVDHNRYGASVYAENLCSIKTSRSTQWDFCGVYDDQQPDNEARLCRCYGLGPKWEIWGNGGGVAPSPEDNFENVCPKDYLLEVDTNAWGMCSCWENGGRRSLKGLNKKCVAALPVGQEVNGQKCASFTNPSLSISLLLGNDNTPNNDFKYWCMAEIDPNTNKVSIGNVQAFQGNWSSGFPADYCNDVVVPDGIIE